MEHSATFTCIKYWIVVVLFVVQIAAEQCTTPNNEKAECISLYSCPVLLNALLENKNDSTEFVSKSNTCGVENKTNNISYDLLAGKEFCGQQHSDDYVRPTTTTSINEFPWVTRIKYRDAQNKSIKNRYKCSATLINSRYVLTAAHCLVNINRLIVESVRLGEYNSRNETDCVEEAALLTECSEPVEDIDVEELIPHPAYSAKTVINDIGLIRLKKKVQYSDYIRPICLPIPGTKLSKVGDVLISTGWGGMHESDHGEVSIKKKIFSKLITNEECAVAFRGLTFTKSHLCTRLLPNNTDLECLGDSGGPVMATNGFQWHQEGIVSTGKGKCAGEEFPELHTNVAQYIDWIVQNIRP